MGASEKDRMEFCLQAITEHKSGEQYKTAQDAEAYYRHENPTIMRYQKFVYDQLGRAVPDTWSPNAKIASNWYFYFTVQSVQYLLGNGVTFSEQTTKQKLGKTFDHQVQKLATYAKNGGAAFGLWNYDHVDAFSVLEFVPLYDEDTGALMAGVRFWQIDTDKPLRVTLYEPDGYTDYIRRDKSEIAILHDKRSYMQTVRTSAVGGTEITDGGNYEGFPIVPFYNINRRSDLCGNKNTIDAYDLMASGLINNVSEGDFLYWVIKSYGGMSELDAVKFKQQIHTTHVASIEGDENTSVDAKQLEVPFEATEAALKALENRLYRDFMALNTEDMRAGNITVPQIEAAYEPLNQKTDQFESCVTAFIHGILALAGIDDEPTYTRSQMSNQSEMVKNVIATAEYTDTEYITKKLLAILGDADQTEDVLRRKLQDEYDRYGAGGDAE